MTVLLEAEGLARTYRTGRRLLSRPRLVRAVREVSLGIGRGETLALVGESGCGKSTVGRLLLRLEEADAGRILFDGADLGALGPAALRALRRRMQPVFQDPYASLDPRRRIRDVLEAPIRLHGLRVGAAAVRARAEELLAEVGLAPAGLARFPHEFSGGQRQRVAIARALAVEPDLLVCDEPVSALDVSVQAQVVNLLADLIRELGLTFVLISHDLGVVRQIADRIAVMYLGRIVEEGPAEDVLRAPRHPYTRALLAAVPGQGGRAVLEGDVPSPVSPPPGCRFHTRCPFAEPSCRTTEQALAGGAGHRAACHLQAALPPPAPLREAPGDARLRRLQSFFLPTTARETAP